MSATPLGNQMRRLAATRHARAGELRKAAMDYERAYDLAFATDGGKDDGATMRRFLGAWARARRLWSECSGEPLI